MAIINGYRYQEGGSRDVLEVPYSLGQNSIMAHLNTAYKHVHNQAYCYPVLASPVTLTKGAGVWTATATKTQVIPVNTITSDFDLHWAMISDISATGNYVLRVYSGLSGAEVLIAETAFFRNGNFVQEGNLPIQVPQIPANSRISAALHGSPNGAETCAIKFYYHTYG